MDIYTDDLATLKPALERYQLSNLIRLAAVMALIVGGGMLTLGVLVGFDDHDERTQAMFMVFGGLPVLAAGLWTSIKRVALGVPIVGGLLVLLAAIQVLLLLVVGIDLRNSNLSLGLTVIFLCLALGLFLLTRYWRVKDAPELPDADLAALHELASKLIRAKPKDDPRLILLALRRSRGMQPWIGQLHQDRLILLNAFQGFWVLGKDAVGMALARGGLPGRLNVTVTLDGQTMLGTISREGFERYQLWKGSDADPDLGFFVPWS